MKENVIMKKASYLFMQINKEPKSTEYQKELAVENISETSVEMDSGVDADLDELDLFDEGLYDNKEPEQIANEIRMAKENEEYNKLNMFGENVYSDKGSDTSDNSIKYPEVLADKEFRVSRKEALTSVEVKSPFIVGKKNSKKAAIEEDDVVYKTIPKISFREGRRAKVIGYVRADKRIKRKRVREKNVIGMLNYDFPVYKKEGFNRDLVGYIKTESDNSDFDSYIKVSKSNIGMKLLILLLVIGLGIGISQIKLPEGWNFENMTLFLTEQNIIRNNINVNIVHDEVMVVGEHGNTFTMQIAGDDNISVEFIGMCGNQELFRTTQYNIDKVAESDIFSGIDIKNIANESNCVLITNVYKAGKYVGKLESQFKVIIE